MYYGIKQDNLHDSLPFDKKPVIHVFVLEKNQERPDSASHFY